MTRVAPAPVEEYAAVFGDDAPQRLQVLAHRPAIAKAHVEYGNVLRKERLLPPRLVELVRLRIAYHNQCRSCMAVRYADAVDDGLTEQLVCSLERPEEAPDLTDAERTALHFADLFATDHLAISDATFTQLREHFDEPEIVELLFNSAAFVGSGRMTSVLRLLDDLPERFRDEEAERVTPWGEGEVVYLGRPRRAG